MTTSAAAAEPPGFALEEELAAGGAARIAGVDEVGRGAWAGPVLVCAAVAGPAPFPEGLTDSKRITAKRRTGMAAELRGWVADHAFGRAEAGEIDALGMTAALGLAARRALDGLSVRPDAVILDGAHDFVGRPWRVRTAVKADLTSATVAAASVLAKVERDGWMAGLDADHPGYGFATAAGYPSPVHRAALDEHGPTPYHRMTWSYLDGLPRWRHLRRPKPGPAGQAALL